MKVKSPSVRLKKGPIKSTDTLLGDCDATKTEALLRAGAEISVTTTKISHVTEDGLICTSVSEIKTVSDTVDPTEKEIIDLSTTDPILAQLGQPIGKTVWRMGKRYIDYGKGKLERFEARDEPLKIYGLPFCGRLKNPLPFKVGVILIYAAIVIAPLYSIYMTLR